MIKMQSTSAMEENAKKWEGNESATPTPSHFLTTPYGDDLEAELKMVRHLLREEAKRLEWEKRIVAEIQQSIGALTVRKIELETQLTPIKIKVRGRKEPIDPEKLISAVSDFLDELDEENGGDE